MRNLTAYFGTNTSNNFINSQSSTTSEEPASLEKIPGRKRYRSTDISAKSLSQDHTSGQTRPKATKGKQHFKKQSSSNLVTLSKDNDVSCSKKTKLRKSVQVTTTDPVTENQEVTNCSNGNVPSQKPVTRTLKSVLIQDCMNSSTTDVNTGSNDNCMKKRKNESDQSDPEEIDSSPGLFGNASKERSKTCKKSCLRELKEKNNLFNYFSTTEKSNSVNDSNIEDSPVNCLKRVKVDVQVHSPPKVRTKSMKSRNAKDNPFLVVRNSHRYSMKSCNFDKIEVIKTEPVVSSTTQKKNTCKKLAVNENSEDSDSSLVFTRKNRSKISTSKFKFDDNTESDGFPKKKPLKDRQPTPLKTKKNVSFCGIDDTTENSQTENGSMKSGSDCDSDASWKMRVQFVRKHKMKPKLKKSKAKTKNMSANSSEDEAVEKIDQNKNSKYIIKANTKMNENDVLLATPKKLAPLFSKQRKHNKKKSNIVDVNDEARRSFLGSGLPDMVKKKIEEQKSLAVEEENCTFYKFPLISHVQQKTDEFIWNLPKISFNLKTLDRNIIVPTCLSFSQFVNKNTILVDSSVGQLDFNFEDEVALLKKLQPGVNVADVCASVKRLNQEAETADSMCWTDKYKPSNCDDLIGNTSSLNRLKEWIESRKRFKIIDSDGHSSSEEFIDPDDSDNESTRNNVAILVGPPGCGKTCVVYMLAKQLGFEVLEVNAALNRNGKRLLDELLEATQSHQVKQASIFNRVTQKKKVERKKKKKRKPKEIKRERKTMSLILIEDVDILFENHDEGFLSALNTLVKQSKRPLIFIANDLNYPHLMKYNNGQNLVLQFSYPSRSLISVWLRLIALIEGVKLTEAVLTDLYRVAGLDLRKSLLQLQMLVSSKICNSLLDTELLFYENWWKRLSSSKDKSKNTLPEVQTNNDDLFSPEKVITVRHKEKTNEEPHMQQISQSDQKVYQANHRSLADHAKFLETVAFLGHFEKSQVDFCSCSNVLSPEKDAHICQLNEDICSFLKQTLFSNFKNLKSSGSFNEYYNLIRKKSRTKAVYANTLSSLKSTVNDSYAKYCDLLPTLRNITRIEQSKQTNQLRRTTRFFSYLNSVSINISDEDNDFLRGSMM